MKSFIIALSFCAIALGMSATASASPVISKPGTSSTIVPDISDFETHLRPGLVG